MVMETEHKKTLMAILDSLMVAILNYYWLPIEGTCLVGDNKAFEVWGVFWGVLSFMDGG